MIYKKKPNEVFGGRYPSWEPYVGGGYAGLPESFMISVPPDAEVNSPSSSPSAVVGGLPRRKKLGPLLGGSAKVRKKQLLGG